MRRIFDFLYASALIVASPWLVYRALFRGRNRRGWRQKLLGTIPRRETDCECIWLHAVSVGEVNLLAPVIERLQQQRPDAEFAISTTTETGFDLARTKYACHTVFFCPFDFSWAVKRALQRLRPSVIVLAELEVWPNLIAIATDQNIPVAVINGRLSESSFRGYRRAGRLLKPTFARLTQVAAANEQYADRFLQLGTPNDRVTVTGTVKFDGVLTDRKNKRTRELVSLARLRPDDFVIVAGSTQPEENLLLARVYQNLKRDHVNARLILVPRHPETSQSVKASVERLGLSVQLRSEMETTTSEASDVLLVDVIGELSAWWGCANAAFVGGSMGGAVGGNRGGQNMIEPAAYGSPVCYGPDTRNFREIVQQLESVKGAVVVDDEATLLAFFARAISEPKWAFQMGQRAQRWTASHAGAADRTVDELVKRLPKISESKKQAA